MAVVLPKKEDTCDFYKSLPILLFAFSVKKAASKRSVQPWTKSIDASIQFIWKNSARWIHDNETHWTIVREYRMPSQFYRIKKSFLRCRATISIKLFSASLVERLEWNDIRRKVDPVQKYCMSNTPNHIKLGALVLKWISRIVILTLKWRISPVVPVQYVWVKTWWDISKAEYCERVYWKPYKI